MTRTSVLASVLVGVLASCAGASAQDAGRVDFARDVQPIFRTYCIGCHGPTTHHNGFRLDRRSDALRGGTISVIGPGNGDASRLVLRLKGNGFGTQMPPTGALKPEQIATISAWIDQGAEWPDAVSGEAPPAPPDPHATRMLEALRSGRREAFRAAAAAAGDIGSRKGANGTTPLMQAVLYGSVDDVRFLLERGADVNSRNDAGATALIWATHDLEKTRVLLARGADVNATTDHGRTALMAAVSQVGAAPVVKLLLEHGANPSAQGSNSSVLLEAALVGDEAVTRMLVDAGADVAASGPATPVLALKAGCAPCADLIAAKLPKPLIDVSLVLAGPPLGDTREMGFFLDRGANVNGRDPSGRTVLMLAAASDSSSAALVGRLIERGADVNARAAGGETALAHARLHGNRDAADLLLAAGALDESTAAARPAPAPAASPRAAIERSLPLLQRSGVTFVKRSGCVSCHNNTLTAMTVAAARARGIAVDETVARSERSAIAAYVDGWRDRALQGIGIPGDNDTVSAMLIGLAAERYPADASTDALANFLVRQQFPDGHFRILAHRPPIESSDIQVTAATLRALQVYTPQADRARFDRARQLAGEWLQHATARSTEDHVYRLLGLTWAGAPTTLVRSAAEALVASQRADGGWAQIPSLASDAYATGQAVYALAESGVAGAAASARARGVQFLLSSQLADGSWFVKSRSIALQPLFDGGFPHGRDQWISAAATNWAALALTTAVR